MEPTRQHRLNWGVNQVVPSPLHPQAGPAPQPVRRFLHERRSHGAWNLPASIGSTGELTSPQAGPAPQPVRRFLHERRSHGA